MRDDFYELYLILDVFSRKIVGWEVHAEEPAAHASSTLTRNLWSVSQSADWFDTRQWWADEGRHLVGDLAMLAVVASFCQLSVSNDNPLKV